MRTTLTLDEDVLALLRREMEEKQLGLKEVLNDALRRGLAGGPKKARKRYRVKPFDTGAASVPLDNIAEVLAIAEGEGFR